MKNEYALLPKKLEKHRQNLRIHFEKASKFLVKCQIIKPYVEKGTLHGCVCPWEIGESADEGAFPIIEDFHDTLEAIWAWSYYTQVSHEQVFKLNVEWAWEYIGKNWNRFIGKEEAENKSTYDCSHVLHSGILYTKVFNNNEYERLLMKAGDRLENYLGKLKSTEGREYNDPFWMAYCLSLAARALQQKKWLKSAEAFVKKTIVDEENPFSRIENEPTNIGPGGHDFFSKNANQALALMSCLNQQSIAKKSYWKNSCHFFLESLFQDMLTRMLGMHTWPLQLVNPTFSQATRSF